MVTLDELETRLSVLEGVVAGAGAPVLGVVQCTAARPHLELIFQRGPNVYTCQACGARYVKDGTGGLREAA